MSDGDLPMGDGRAERDPTAVLIVDPPGPGVDPEACVTELASVARGPGSICRVEFTRSLAGWLDTLTARSETDPPSITVVNATGTSVSLPAAVDPGAVTVTEPIRPTNLTRLGTRLTEFLGTAGDRQGRPGVCVHTVTRLLQHVSEPLAFRFLDQVIAQSAAADGYVHYHMSPEVHDPTTLNLFATLADQVLEEVTERRRSGSNP